MQTIHQEDVSKFALGILKHMLTLQQINAFKLALHHLIYMLTQTLSNAYLGAQLTFTLKIILEDA